MHRPAPRSVPAQFLFALLLFCLAGATGASEDAASPAGEPLKVVLLPPKVAVLKLGLVKVESSPEWTAAAAAAVEQAVHEALRQSSRLSVVEMPALTPDEDRAIGAFLSMRLLEQMLGHGNSIVGKSSRGDHLDPASGPALAFLAERTGADIALGVTAWQCEQSDGSAAVGWLGAAASFVVPGLILLPSVSGSQAQVFLFDMRTGTMQWLEGSSGYEVGGYNFTDLRDPQSAAEVFAGILESLPETATLRSQAAPEAPTAKNLAERPVAPKRLMFSFRPPEGWQLRPVRNNSVELSRYSNQIDTIEVELRPNWRAFPKSGQVSTPESTPDELLQKFIAELATEEPVDLRILETAVDAELGGRAAFRVRFSQQMEPPFENLRIERVAIGSEIPRGFLIGQLSAPEMDYFPQALPVFEESMRSLLLVTPHNYPRRPSADRPAGETAVPVQR